MPPRSTRKSILRSNNENAGEAIAAGGFGCVFRPPIKCRDPLLNRALETKPYITKLMRKSDAKSEMAENVRILSIVKDIPNYKQYFLLDDIFECSDFGPLTASDKTDFDTTCRNLGNLGITADNVNRETSRQKLSAINIPDGGVSIYDRMMDIGKEFIKKKDAIALEKFGLLNWGLISTLERAIIPMNKLGLLHLDLKGENMLVNTDFYSLDNRNVMPKVYVIDWGLAGVIGSNTKDLIPEVTSGPLQFNVPFSNILFNPETQQQITDYCMVLFDTAKTENFLPKSALKPLAAFLLHNNAKFEGSGHTSYINQCLQFLTRVVNIKIEDSHKQWNISDDCFQNSSLVYNYVINYLAKILERYLNPHENKTSNTEMFDAERYFHEVYRHNVDIWGFLMSYLNFCMAFNQRHNIINSNNAYRANPVALHASDILFQYCFSDKYAADKIPLGKLIRDLKYLSVLCGVPKPKKSKAKLKRLVFYDDDEITMPEGKKRCPKGYNRIPKTQKCRKNTNLAKTKKVSRK